MKFKPEKYNRLKGEKIIEQRNAEWKKTLYSLPRYFNLKEMKLLKRCLTKLEKSLNE